MSRSEIVAHPHSRAFPGALRLAFLAIFVWALVPQTLAQSGSPQRGWLGVALESPPERRSEARQRADAARVAEESADEGEAGLAPAADKPRQGAWISAVVRDSPADRAGIRALDTVIAIDGDAVESPGDVMRLIGEGGPDRWVQLTLERRGRERTVTARLQSLPDADRLRDLKEGWAGLAFVEIPEQLRRYWGGSDAEGVLIGEVVEGGPASRAGLYPGDLLLAIDDIAVVYGGDATQRMRRAGEDNVLELAISRQGSPMTIELELDALPPDEPSPTDSRPDQRRERGRGRRAPSRP